eukprot:415309_1
MAKPQDEILSTAESFILPTLCAFGSKTIAAPFERIKLILQLRRTIKQFNFETTIDETSLNSRFILSSFSKSDILASFSGNFYNCIRYPPIELLRRSIKPLITTKLRPNRNDPYITKLLKSVVSGSLHGCFTLSLVYCLDRIRTLLAVGMRNKYDNNHWRFGITQPGFNISCLGVFLYRALYYITHDGVSLLLPPNATTTTKFICGYLATIAAGILTYPLDTIRRRQMISGEMNSIIVYKDMVNKHGYISLFDGALWNIIRGMIGVASIHYIEKYFVDKYIQRKWDNIQLKKRRTEIRNLIALCDYRHFQIESEYLLFDGYIREFINIYIPTNVLELIKDRFYHDPLFDIGNEDINRLIYKLRGCDNYNDIDQLLNNEYFAYAVNELWRQVGFQNVFKHSILMQLNVHNLIRDLKYFVGRKEGNHEEIGFYCDGCEAIVYRAIITFCGHWVCDKCRRNINESTKCFCGQKYEYKEGENAYYDYKFDRYE